MFQQVSDLSGGWLSPVAVPGGSGRCRPPFAITAGQRNAHGKRWPLACPASELAFWDGEGQPRLLVAGHHTWWQIFALNWTALLVPVVDW